MITARERLLQALRIIFSQPYSEENKVTLLRTLNSYRFQQKTGKDEDEQLPARDGLALSLISAWQQGPTLDRSALVKLLAPFRMQLKRGLARKSQAVESKSEALEKMTPGLDRFSKRADLKGARRKVESVYFNDKVEQNTSSSLSITPVGGGPRKQGSKRGQCPKCKSLGIVLARAYGTEDYYSCIYCGHESYTESDPALDLPMAASMLADSVTNNNDED